MHSKKPDGYLAAPDEKRRYNRRLFGVVSPRYALVNRLLSFNRDTVWKKWLIVSRSFFFGIIEVIICMAT